MISGTKYGHSILPPFAAVERLETASSNSAHERPTLSRTWHTEEHRLLETGEGAQMTPPVQPAYSRKFQFSITPRPSERRSKRCLHQRRLSGCGHEAGTHSLTGQRPIFEARERNEAAVWVYEDVLRLQQSCLMAHAAGQGSRCMLHNVSWHMRMFATSTRVAPLLVDSAAASATLSTSQPHYVSQENLSNNGDHIFATFDTRVLLLCGIHVYSTQRPIGWINSVVAFRDQAIGWSSHPPGFPPELSEGEPNPLRRSSSLPARCPIF